ncbi:hypothetical protein CCH79_00016675, partial [Gambusia affinis]
VKESQQVKLLFSEQLSKLQSKQHQDTELLEEIRSFSKQRAAIEKEYAQALQRLAVQYQKRDWQRGNTDTVISGSVFGVWRSVVDATAHIAASRLAAAEEYRRLFGHASKSIHNAKEIRAKRVLEQLQRVQGEVVDALRELHRVKKSYHHLGHIAGVAREKVADAQMRTRKSEHGIFHFKSAQQKMTAKVTRERNVQQFLQESISFTRTSDFIFQPALRDVMTSLQDMQGSEGESCLVKEAKKWAAKAAKDYKIATHGERALEMLESRQKVLSGETGLNVEQKITEVQETVRKAKLSRVKAEARLALLALSVTGTQQWLHNAMKQADEELETERRLSEQRRSTEEFSEDEFELTDFEDYDDENGDIFADPVSASRVCVYPAACRVVYSYQASQSDELSVTEGEELHVVEDGDVEDWLKVCNSCGQVGYIPERYVQFQCLPAEDAAQLDSSFSSSSSSGIKERPGATGVVKALYSYQAQSAEELSFQEGALIRLIRCPHGEVDDGFWEGELDGRIGFFPSLLVELLHEEEEEEEEKEPLNTAAIPPCSSTVPIPSTSAGDSANTATPPAGVEDKQQSVHTEESRVAVSGSSSSANELHVGPLSFTGN